ncbi:response regulator transcription factor [Micromonospora sp. NIE79]|uniref:Response regulator transcription factor n=1 Tax=Micromonospora trifolii TaxID=2911208 RepID=A0ABS9MXJ5_9ACTN|nr:response regulator transcription factor [Micromonospora trifolii]MCG5442377.1 response regulator transcription factor [Micromonospora trifolii]
MSAPGKIKILVASEHPPVRTAIGLLLNSTPGMSAVAEAADGAAATMVARRIQPNVILLDFDSDPGHCVDTTARLTSDPALGGIGVLVFTARSGPEQSVRLLRAGARSVLSKETSAEGLLDAIRVVAAGSLVLSPDHAGGVLRHVGRSDGETCAAMAGEVGLGLLSLREREVLALVAQGYNNTEIARRLHISDLTAKTHVSRIRVKLDARDRVQLVLRAYAAGLSLHATAEYGQSA